MAETATGRGPEPGMLGMAPKTVGFPMEGLDEYRRLVESGVVDINFPAFVRQAFLHELARYRAEEQQKRRSKK
jgi:hypothetical protein